MGNIDIAIHNACLCTFESEHDTDYEVYKRVFEVNYFGALRLSKLVLPIMRKKGNGRVIERHGREISVESAAPDYTKMFVIRL